MSPPAASSWSGEIPAAFAGHSLVRGRHFYTIPRELLESVVEEVGESGFDRNVLALDRALSEVHGDHSHRIGFHGGRSIAYDLLATTKSVAVTLAEVPDWIRQDPAMSWMAKSTADRATLKAADERLAWTLANARGYAGWLATNPQFAREQAELLTRFAEPVRALGLGVQVAGGDTAAITGVRTRMPESQANFLEARERLQARRQLRGLAGPFLPDPVRTSMPLLDSQQGRQASSMGASVFLARIFPLPDRRMLREMLEDAAGREQLGEHLLPWLEIVRADSQAKKSIERYGRLFVLQHYWRVVRARHVDAIGDRLPLLRRAFASWLFPKAHGPELAKKETLIRKDLDALATARGGADWPLRLPEYDGF